MSTRSIVPIRNLNFRESTGQVRESETYVHIHKVIMMMHKGIEIHASMLDERGFC